MEFGTLVLKGLAFIAQQSSSRLQSRGGYLMFSVRTYLLQLVCITKHAVAWFAITITVLGNMMLFASACGPEACVTTIAFIFWFFIFECIFIIRRRFVVPVSITVFDMLVITLLAIEVAVARVAVVGHHGRG